MASIYQKLPTEWAWDQFDLERRGTSWLSDIASGGRAGELDITNDDFLDQQTSLTRDERNEFETRFIDELYGTNDAVWTAEGMPYDDNTGQGLLRTSGSYVPGSMVTMGLDLRRLVDPNNPITVGSDEHYEWLTRGEIDWESYENDSAYQTAFDIMRNDVNNEYRDFNYLSNYSNIEDFLGDRSDEISMREKIDFIRAAGGIDQDNNYSDDLEDHDADPNDPNSWWNTWQNKYETQFDEDGNPKDPDRWEPYTATPMFDPATIDVGMRIRTDVATPSSVHRPNFRINYVNVNRPSNIPASWGTVGTRGTVND